MKRYLPVFVILLLAVLSCKKEQKGYPYVYNPVADYAPTTPGSTWKYGVGYAATPGVYLDSITVTMTTDQLNMDGKAFAVALASSSSFNGISQFYFYKTNDKYKVYSTILSDQYTGTLFDVPFALNGAVLNRDTTVYFPNTDASKPAEWGIETYTNTEFEKVTINGTTYNYCINSDVTILKLYDGTDPEYIGQYQVYDTYQFLIAPNVGIIKEIAGVAEITLMSSNIKQ